MTRRLAWGLLGAAVWAGACSKPPTKEIDAAQAQVALAREQVEDDDYRAAAASAQQASDRARSAQQAVSAARTLARGRAQVALAEVRAVMDDIDGVVRDATAAKVPDDAFAAVVPQAQALRDGLAGIEGLLDKDPLRAEAAVGELRAHASDLATAFRQAHATWMARNRQSKGRKAAFAGR